jgi:hypothetical protein
MVYFIDTFHDTVSEAVVTKTELDLYVKGFSHSKTLWSTLLHLLEGKLYFHDIMSDTMVTNLLSNSHFFYTKLFCVKTYELTNLVLTLFSMYFQV